MQCPACGSKKIRTPNSRHDTIESIVRRRKCCDCDHNWWTVEVDLPLESVKWKIEPNRGDGKRRNRYPIRLPGAQRVTFS